LELGLPDSKYSKQQQVTAFYRRIQQRIESLPGVQSVGAINYLPFAGDITNRWEFSVEGRPPIAAGVLTYSEGRVISPHYFGTMEISLLRGRGFADNEWVDAPDSVEESQKTVHPVIINQAMASHYWPDEDPIGKRINGAPRGLKPEWLSVVGVVADVRQFGLDGEPTFDIYLPRYQSRMYLVIRTHSEPANLAAAVRAEIRREDKELPISKVQTMEQLLSGSVSLRRFSGLLLGLFASLALILSIVGIYGVISYSVSQRTHELGLRMALGAQQSDVLRLVVMQGLKLTLTGLAFGVAAAFVVSRFLSSLLFGVSPTDLPTFVTVSLVLATVALLACYIPARRATKVDPVVALRYE